MELSTIEVMNKGMDCLVENLGVLDAERFIAFILRERFDYTKWQREYFDQIPEDEFMEQAVEYAKTHPFKGKAEIL